MGVLTPFVRAARALIASRAAKGTRSLYTSDLDRWLFFCAHTQVDPADPPLEAAVAHRDALQVSYAPLTVRRTLAALSKMYRAAQGARVATWNPFDGDALPRPPADAYARTEAVPEALAQRIISSCEEDTTLAGVRDLAVLRLLYDTGMRRASVASLKRDNVIERDARMVISFYVKGGKWREKTLPEAAATAVRRWLAVNVVSVYVFPQDRDQDKPIDPSTVNRIVTRRAEGSGVHPHQFRAAFATLALDHMPLHEVQAAMDHADPRMTLRYDRKARGGAVTDRVAEMRAKKP